MSECVDEWVCGSVDEWVWMKECVGAMLLVPLTCVQDVIRYSLVGDTIDQEFFYLNEDSGFISLRKTLLTTTTSQFRVRPHLLFRHLSDYSRPAPKPPFTTLQLKVGPLPFHHLSVHGASPPLLSPPRSSGYVRPLPLLSWLSVPSLSHSASLSVWGLPCAEEGAVHNTILFSA